MVITRIPGEMPQGCVVHLRWSRRHRVRHGPPRSERLRRTAAKRQIRGGPGTAS